MSTKPKGLNKIAAISNVRTFLCYKEELRVCYNLEEKNGVVQAIPKEQFKYDHVKKIIHNKAIDNLFEMEQILVIQETSVVRYINIL